MLELVANGIDGNKNGIKWNVLECTPNHNRDFNLTILLLRRKLGIVGLY